MKNIAKFEMDQRVRVTSKDEAYSDIYRRSGLVTKLPGILKIYRVYFECLKREQFVKEEDMKESTNAIDFIIED